MIPPRLEPTIFRLVQESLNNVAKHANASNVQVKIYCDEARQNVTVELWDNGCGFEPAANHHGLGLRQMKARVASVGGDFQLISTPGQGTVVAANLPAARGYDE